MDHFNQTHRMINIKVFVLLLSIEGLLLKRRILSSSFDEYDAEGEEREVGRGDQDYEEPGQERGVQRGEERMPREMCAMCAMRELCAMLGEERMPREMRAMREMRGEERWPRAMSAMREMREMCAMLGEERNILIKWSLVKKFISLWFISIQGVPKKRGISGKWSLRATGLS